MGMLYFTGGVLGTLNGLLSAGLAYGKGWRRKGTGAAAALGAVFGCYEIWICGALNRDFWGMLLLSGALLAMYQTTVQANTFKSAMTYEILLIVVIGGIGSISGSCIGSFLFIACSEWWLRFLDNETTIGAFKVPLLRTGFRMVVFSVVIMIVVLFFRRGIMGDREISLAGLAKRLTRRSVKGGKEA